MKQLQFIKKVSNSLLNCDSNYINFTPDIKINKNTNKPNILIICTFSIFGGIEMHCLSLYRYLKKNGYNAQIIIPKNSVLEIKFTEEKLSFYSYKQSKIFKPNRQPGLRKVINNIIKKHNIDIVHCNRAKDSHLLRNISTKVKLIFTRHAPSLIRNKYIKKFDAIAGVNKRFVNKTQKKFPQKTVIHITPFFSEDESLNFVPNTNKQDFFKKEFCVKLQNYPTIVQVASLSNVKNHELLFKALSELIHKKNKPVNMLLCGDGYNKKYLQKLAIKLNIQNYIYFLGFTNKRIEVIFHSDIKTLTSKSESHSISLMEAALLKKPLIGPTNTGVINTIKHEKTGLLFENNNAQNLAKQIERLLDSPKLRKKYGQNAYKHVKNNFTSDILIKKLEILHTQVWKKQGSNMKIEKLHVPFGFYKTEYVSFKTSSTYTKIDPSKPAILTLNSPFKFDGLVMHTLSHYKAHLKEGYDTYIFLPKGSELEKFLIEQKLPYYRFTQSKIFRNHSQPGMKRIIEAIVKKHNIKIIHCNRHKEIKMLRNIKNLNIKIILTRHSPSALKTKYLNEFKTMFCVDQNCIDKINKKCIDKNITPPKIKHLAPFFDEKESLNFDPTKILNKKEFFKKEFGISLPDYPTIVMVACLRGYKNHQLMFKAIHKLVHEKKNPVNLLLCGQGYREKYLRTLAKQLKIEEYVHFLGFTYKRIEVIYHSDIKALTTKDEAFGIVLMEAALLKKPLLGPTKTGVVNTIKHEKTGLLFENGNVDNLVEKIEKLIKNPELRKQYGENAYEHVKNNFLSDVLIKSVGDFYKEIM